MAETYGILDMFALPAGTAAVLACGLPTDCRSKRTLSGVPATRQEILLAGIFDKLSLLVWMQTKDGRNGQNRPPSMTEKLLGKQEEKPEAFESAEDFERARARILENLNGD